MVERRNRLWSTGVDWKFHPGPALKTIVSGGISFVINRSFLLLPGTITVKTNEWKYVNDCFINIFSNITGNAREPLAVSKAKAKRNTRNKVLHHRALLMIAKFVSVDNVCSLLSPSTKTVCAENVFMILYNSKLNKDHLNWQCVKQGCKGMFKSASQLGDTCIPHFHLYLDFQNIFRFWYTLASVKE